MHNVKNEKRICPNDSFTIACGLSLHNCSGTRYEKIRKSTPFLLLPNKRSLFTGLSASNIPLDSFFSTKMRSAYSSILLKMCEWLKSKLVACDNNGALHHPMIVMDLHLNEVRVIARHSFSNKSHHFGAADNDVEELAAAMQCYLMTTSTGKKISINLASKPVHKMKTDYLTKKLLEHLNKSDHCGCQAVPIILDGAPVNSKLARDLLQSACPNNDTKNMKVPELKLKPYFVRNRKKRFILFCLVHIIKSIRNSLCKKNNFFKYPSLTLSTGHSIEAGVCSMHLIRESHHENKHKLLCNVRISQETACPSNLGKQKVKPALKLFSKNLTAGSCDKFGESAKGTCAFLELIQNYAIQPLLRTNSCKHEYDLKAMPFKDVNDVRLVRLTEIADWTQIWHATLKFLPENMTEGAEEEINECLEDYDLDDSTSMTNEIEMNENAIESKKKKGRKNLHRGFSEETFFSLSHALRTYATCIKHMLTEK